MITKVTSANYDAYTLLFNQADAALKEYNGIETAEFLDVKVDDTFNPNAQYFNKYKSPIEFANAEEFAARAERDDAPFYVLNEQMIYDLDTYFGKLELLTAIDYGFLKMPIDEPTFDILDEELKGRRVISVPEDFAKNGISVQGDETAEILFFTIDRYYDATDLWSEGMNYIIQWQAGEKKGVTKAFLNKNSRPFIDKNKLYFGWPISSEITDTPGNVTFSVRIFKFANGTDENGKPKLAFGLNTQTATVKVNESLTYEITQKVNENIDFKDAELVNKNADLVTRVINSTVLTEDAQETAVVPEWNENILSDEDLASAIRQVTVRENIYTLATGAFKKGETYYNIDHEPVPMVIEGLNKIMYRPNVYYTMEPVDTVYYEFDYEDVKDKIRKVQALVPSGIITYTGRSQVELKEVDGVWTAPEGVGGSFEFDVRDEVIYKHVRDSKRLTNHRYYEFNEATGKYTLAANIKTEPEQEWDEEDKYINNDSFPCKYFERWSPLLVINENKPVGCYYIVANNNEGRKSMSSIDSYRIWIPGPVELEESAVVFSEDASVNEEEQQRILVQNNKANFGVEVTDIPHNTTVYEWFGERELEDTALQEITYEESELPALDEIYTVEIHTERNKNRSKIEEDIVRSFRVTAPAFNFEFDSIIDSDEELEALEANESLARIDQRKVILHPYYEENANTFEIDYSLNLDANDELKMVSDAVAYRFRLRHGRDVGAQNIFINDDALDLTAEHPHWFTLITKEEGGYTAIPDLVVPEVGFGKEYYLEIINIVNEDFDIDDLNRLADLVANEETRTANAQEWYDKYETRIARTPYYKVTE